MIRIITYFLSYNIGFPMFEHAKFRTKIAFGYIFAAVLTIIVTIILSLQVSKNLIVSHSFEMLKSIREEKKQQIESFFTSIQNQLITFANDFTTINALQEFTQGFNAIDKSQFTDFKEMEEKLQKYYQKDYIDKLNLAIETKRTVKEYYSLINDRTKILQYYFIANNPKPLEKKYELISTDMKNEYNTIHEKYHPIFRDYLEKFNYYDLFLVDAKTGNIVYTIVKEVDFATNLNTGPYKDSNLAKAFHKALELPTKNSTILIDFAPYDPSYGAPAAFIASPIFKDSEKIGVLIFQLPVDRMNEILTNNKKWEEVGLKETGETYLGSLSDTTMRSISRFFLENPSLYLQQLKDNGAKPQMINRIKLFSTTILWQTIATEIVKKAGQESSTIMITHNYLGKEVLSAYTKLAIQDLSWGIFAEISTQEVYKPLYDLLYTKLLWSLFILFILLIIIYVYLQVIIPPFRGLSQAYQNRVVQDSIDLSDIATNHEAKPNHPLNHFKKIISFIRSHISALGALVPQILNKQKNISQSFAAFEQATSRISQTHQTMQQGILSITKKIEELRNHVTAQKSTIEECTVSSNANMQYIDTLKKEASILEQHLKELLLSADQKKSLLRTHQLMLQDIEQVTTTRLTYCSQIKDTTHTIAQSITNLEKKCEQIATSQPEQFKSHGALLNLDVEHVAELLQKISDIDFEDRKLAKANNNHYKKLFDDAQQMSSNNTQTMNAISKKIDELFVTIDKIQLINAADESFIHTIMREDSTTKTLLEQTEVLYKNAKQHMHDLNSHWVNYITAIEKVSLAIDELKKIKEKFSEELQAFKIKQQ